MQHIYTCALCSEQLKNAALLGRHLHYNHKHDKQSYYDQFLGGPGQCAVCEESTKFLNLSKGYNTTCSLRCATKLQWLNDDGTRSENASKRFTENNIGVPGARKGSRNKNKYPVTEAVLRRWKDNPTPDWTGKKHSSETREKMAQTRLDKIASGEIKIMASYKGRFAPKNPQKYKGDPTNIVYRSSWELKVMRKLDEHPDVITWSSEEVIIPYRSPIDNRIHRYFVDYYAKLKTREGVIKEVLIEVKPKHQTVPPKLQDGKKPTKRYLNEVATWGVNSAKWAAARAYCADRNWSFEIFHEDHIGVSKSNF